MADFELPEEDRLALRDILIQQRSEGVEDPLIPLNVDIDGDGIADAWALDENDDVVLRPGVKLEDTVYVSDGDDVDDLTGYDGEILEEVE